MTAAAALADPNTVDDAMRDTMTPTAGDDALPLVKCLELFSEEETLGQDEPWLSALRARRALKTIELWTTPPVLVSPRRFLTRAVPRACRTRVAFPLEGSTSHARTCRAVRSRGGVAAPAVPPRATRACLRAADGDVANGVKAALCRSRRWCQPRRPRPRARGRALGDAACARRLYDLCAVSNHMGSLQSGYALRSRLSYRRRVVGVDDAPTRHVADTARIVSEAAYLLFYLRRDYRPASWGEPNGSSSASRSRSRHERGRR